MADHSGWMIYGATGFTGELIAAEAARRGLRPILAGRSEAKLRPMAERLGFPFRAVSLDDRAGLRRALDGVKAVLHSAGPFVKTSAPMVDACLEVGAHYLDITGELEVFRAVMARDEEARARGVSLIPGVGFDVVPTDCLARYVAEKVPGAQELELAISAINTQASAGTAKSALGIVTGGGYVRQGGELRSVPLGRGIRRQRFSQRERWVMPAPLGDLVTAYKATGIPSITTYIAIPTRMARLLRPGWPAVVAARPIARRLLRVPLIEERVERYIEATQRGSDEAKRREGRSFVWARAAGGGRSAEAWLEMGEAYEYTACSTVSAVEQVLQRQPAGATTPALAFGADFAIGVPGTRRLDSLP
jgi:short subunit dehydrogenase-like uncharacterized protein